jgi:hypothetical protein
MQQFHTPLVSGLGLLLAFTLRSRVHPVVLSDSVLYHLLKGAPSLEAVTFSMTVNNEVLDYVLRRSLRDRNQRHFLSRNSDFFGIVVEAP